MKSTRASICHSAHTFTLSRRKICTTQTVTAFSIDFMRLYRNVGKVASNNPKNYRCLKKQMCSIYCTRGTVSYTFAHIVFLWWAWNDGNHDSNKNCRHIFLSINTPREPWAWTMHLQKEENLAFRFWQLTFQLSLCAHADIFSNVYRNVWIH